jgi:hypothetical protein
MTEDQIERIAERTMNGLDHALLTHALTQEEYDREVVALDKWVSQQCRGIED